MSRRNRSTLVAVVAVLAFAFLAPPAQARRDKEPVFAQSAADPALRNQIAALAPGVSREEARLAVATAYTTGRELALRWRVVWPPGLQNFLVNSGEREGGLCFQWATELLIRLEKLQLKTLELHWAEAYPSTASEHNVIVVTAKGQPFVQGILLDNWRYSGQLVWGPVSRDPHYEWKENSAELTRRLQARNGQSSRPKRGPAHRSEAN